MKRLTQRERETLIASAYDVVHEAFVCSRRGIRMRAELAPEITRERKNRKLFTVVTLRPTNGILDKVRLKRSWLKHARKRRINGRTYREVRTGERAIVRFQVNS